MKDKVGALIVLVALSSVVMMLGYQKYAPRPAKEPTVAIPQIRVQPSEPLGRPGSITRPGVKPQAARETTLFVARASRNEMSLVPFTAKLDEVTPLSALRALASFTPRGEDEPTLPKGTKVLGVTVSGTGTATADFSQEIVDHFNGGSRSEQLLLASIVNTLTEFPNIKRVAIRVEGKEVDSIGGHIELDEPLERDVEFLSNE
jgi:spore germination protein GerM